MWFWVTLQSTCPSTYKHARVSVQWHPTRVIQEELERALDAAEEAVDDHVVNVFHVGPPLLRGRLPSEQLQIFLRQDKTWASHSTGWAAFI